MPTTTPELRANRSADRRLQEAHDRLAKARHADRQSRGHDDKWQWGALTAWLLSESKHLDDESRRRMFDHLWECARQMNDGSRRG